MKQLKITKAKPNPAGKDRFAVDIPASQLGGEWVEFKNTGDESFSLNNIELNHIAYTTSGERWEVVTTFSGILESGESVRVHSGAGPITALKPIDIAGADYHIFTGKGYVWNNDRLDRPALWETVSQKWIDRTYYDAYPPDGVILYRISDKLVP